MIKYDAKNIVILINDYLMKLLFFITKMIIVGKDNSCTNEDIEKYIWYT